MPFGKHVGEDVEDLPGSYLIWLVENCDLYGRLEAAIRRELKERGFDFGERSRRKASPPPPPPANGVNVPLAERGLFGELVNAGYRTLAMRHHPDHGGDLETMQRLNRLVEALRQQL